MNIATSAIIATYVFILPAVYINKNNLLFKVDDRKMTLMRVKAFLLGYIFSSERENLRTNMNVFQ